MRVRRRERAAGVDVRLLAFLDWWEVHGPFELLVLSEGGLRTNEARQAEFFRAGRSKARTLAETAHGRGGALDAAPYVQGRVPWDDWGLFEIYGVAAEAHRLAWGGRWKSLRDGPHIEVPDWRTLPFPPTSPPPEPAR